MKKYILPFFLIVAALMDTVFMLSGHPNRIWAMLYYIFGGVCSFQLYQREKTKLWLSLTLLFAAATLFSLFALAFI